MTLPSLDELLEGDLFELLGIQEVDEQKKAALVKSMTETIEARAVNRITGLLSEAEAEQFGRLAEANESEKLVQFLVDHQIDLPQIVSEEATRLRVELIELTRLVQEK